MLTLYRDALRLRRELALGEEPLSWLPSPTDVLAFRRGGGFLCLVNFGDTSVDPPTVGGIVLSSGPLESDGGIPGATAIWAYQNAMSGPQERDDICRQR